MRKNLLLLVGLLIGLTSFAQSVTPLAWQGYRPNVFEQTVLLDSTWTGTATVKAYTEPGGRLISTLLQPTVSRTGNALFIRFLNTAGMSNSTYVTIATGSTVRRAGYLTLGYSTGIVAGGSDSGGSGGLPGIITTDMVLGLPLQLSQKVNINDQTGRDAAQDSQINQNAEAVSQELAQKAPLADLAAKLDVVISTSTTQTTAAKVGSSKLIIETVSGALTIYIYCPTASPTLQKILTYN